jgi:hypothetical protein
MVDLSGLRNCVTIPDTEGTCIYLRCGEVPAAWIEVNGREGDMKIKLRRKNENKSHFETMTECSKSMKTIQE